MKRFEIKIKGINFTAVQDKTKMEKSIIELQKIARLQVCDISIMYGERITFDFFCPECHLKYGVLSKHNITIETSQTTFNCPLNRCRAKYAFTFVPDIKSGTHKVKISKIGAYGTINK